MSAAAVRAWISNEPPRDETEILVKVTWLHGALLLSGLISSPKSIVQVLALFHVAGDHASKGQLISFPALSFEAIRERKEK